MVDTVVREEIFQGPQTTPQRAVGVPSPNILRSILSDLRISYEEIADQLQVAADEIRGGEDNGTLRESLECMQLFLKLLHDIRGCVPTAMPFVDEFDARLSVAVAALNGVYNGQPTHELADGVEEQLLPALKSWEKCEGDVWRVIATLGG